MIEIFEASFSSIRRQAQKRERWSKGLLFHKKKMKREGKNVKQKREEREFPILPSKALKVALEDAQTSHFIKTNFSWPEQRPRIISRKKLFRQNQEYRWIVEFIEKIPLSINGKNGMMNIARIEVDPFNGKVIERRFFNNVFKEEYEKAVCQRSKRPCR